MILKKSYVYFFGVFFSLMNYEIHCAAIEGEDVIVIKYEDYNGIKSTYNPFVNSLIEFMKIWQRFYDKGIIQSLPNVMINKQISTPKTNNNLKSGFHEPTEKIEVLNLTSINSSSQGNTSLMESNRLQKSISFDEAGMVNDLNSKESLERNTTEETTTLKLEENEHIKEKELEGPSRFPNCSFTVSGPSKESPCIFPFYFNTKVFHHCTKEDDFNDPNHELWCSTKTDSQGYHIGGNGNWGYCNQECNYFIFLANMIFDQASENIDCPRESCINYNYCDTFVDKMHDIQVTYNTKNIHKLSRHVCDKRGYRICCNSSTNYIEDVQPSTTLAPISTPLVTENKDVLSPVVLTLNESRIVDQKSSQDGRWLPTLDNFECSKDISYNPGFIVGGRESNLGEFPHAALLGFFLPDFNSTYYLCGGTLINRRYVLTAAHCHNPSSISTSVSEVVIGEWDVTRDPDCAICNPVQRFKIENKDVLRHELWNPETYLTVGNDIAMIRLPALVKTFNEDPSTLVLPACLDWKHQSDPLSSYEEEIKKEFIVTGWGRTTRKRTNNRDFIDYGILQSRLTQTEVEYVKKSQCQDYRTYRRGLAYNHICFNGKENSDSCEGDSGGAVIKRYDHRSQMIVQAIVSFGTVECGRGIPGIYTNIREYISWIIENLRE